MDPGPSTDPRSGEDLSGRRTQPDEKTGPLPYKRNQRSDKNNEVFGGKIVIHHEFLVGGDWNMTGLFFHIFRMIFRTDEYSSGRDHQPDFFGGKSRFFSEPFGI